MQLLVGPYALSGMNRTVSGLEVIGGSFDATSDHSHPPGGITVPETSRKSFIPGHHIGVAPFAGKSGSREIRALEGDAHGSYRLDMAALNPQRPALRVSDADRDEVIKVLREGSADGRLSHDTFLHRLDLALQARYPEQLASLLSDLRPARRGLADRTAAAWDGLTGRLRGAWWAVRLPRLVLPRGGGRTVFTIGRAGYSDLALPDMTVSWRHAELRRIGDEWVLADLGSTNGTRANGWKVGSGFLVRAGDRVTFGQVEFRLCDPPTNRY
jgi:hypothetical protein